jgi:hypothetical protein
MAGPRRRAGRPVGAPGRAAVVQPRVRGLVGGAPPHPVEQQRQRHVVRRGELRDELAELEHEAERGPAQPSAFSFAKRVKALPVEPHLAAVGFEDPGQAVQQG